jgi:hypothetical protein
MDKKEKQKSDSSRSPEGCSHQWLGLRCHMTRIVFLAIIEVFRDKMMKKSSAICLIIRVSDVLSHNENQDSRVIEKETFNN